MEEEGKEKTPTPLFPGLIKRGCSSSTVVLVDGALRSFVML